MILNNLTPRCAASSGKRRRNDARFPYDYDAWGNLIDTLGNTPNRYLFTGEQYDPDLGFYYLRARYTDPDRGRFWTMDVWEGSEVQPKTLHVYQYAGANPLVNIDPSGNTFVGLIMTTLNVAVGTLGRILNPGFLKAVGFSLNVLVWNQVGIDLGCQVSGRVPRTSEAKNGFFADLENEAIILVAGSAPAIYEGIKTAISRAKVAPISIGQFYATMSWIGAGAVVGFGVGFKRGMEGNGCGK